MMHFIIFVFFHVAKRFSFEVLNTLACISNLSEQK